MQLFVGNRPWSTTEDELYQLFAAYGSVAGVRLVRNRGSRRSRGFGFVVMADPAAAQAAIAGLHGTALAGRPLTVSQARQQAESPPPPERRPRW
jgi:RNA recognition motif-containing protein